MLASQGASVDAVSQTKPLTDAERIDRLRPIRSDTSFAARSFRQRAPRWPISRS